MTVSMFSERWYRVAQLHPRLRADVVVNRQAVRGELWYLLSVSAASRTFRVNATGWALAGRCDGSQTVQAIWDQVLADRANDAPTQDELIGLLAELYKSGVLDFEQAPDVDLLLEQSHDERKRKRAERLNPLSLRLSLGDPSDWLARLDPLAVRLFSRTAGLAWGLLALIAIGLVFANGQELLAHAGRWLQTPRYLLIGWLVYPFVKLAHEAAHGMALRRFGGSVREWGISMFVLVPMPWVDASAASLLASRWQRALVSAAGIIVELGVAALALMVWSVVSDGLVRDIAFTLVFIGGVSTVMFNINPLMRMDGYYLLCDVLELPNLAARSATAWRWWITRHLLRVAGRDAPHAAPGERRWLAAYGPLSWLYRIAVAAWLIIWAGGVHPMLGVLVTVACCGWMLGRPLVGFWRAMAQELPSGRQGRGARLRLMALGGSAIAVFTLLPLPDRIVAQGVVWPSDQAQVRPGVEGFVTTIEPTGKPVRSGEPVARLDDPTLEADFERLSSRRQGLQAQLWQVIGTDLFKARQANEELTAIDDQLAQIARRREQLLVRAGQDGLLTVAREQDLGGRFFKQGETVAHVLDQRPPVVRVGVYQEDAALLRQGIQAVRVRLVDDMSATQPARVLRMTPSAVERLPTSALGDRAGGELQVDPQDKDATRPARPVYQLDVELPQLQGAWIGGRAQVRFDLGHSSAAQQLLRHLRQLVLMRFSPFES